MDYVGIQKNEIQDITNEKREALYTQYTSFYNAHKKRMYDLIAL